MILPSLRTILLCFDVFFLVAADERRLSEENQGVAIRSSGVVYCRFGCIYLWLKSLDWTSRKATSKTNANKGNDMTINRKLVRKILRDQRFLETMCHAWDAIEEEMDAEIASLKERIAQLEESAEAHADADQARAMAKAENDEWRERELSEDFYRNMESGPETPSDRF